MTLARLKETFLRLPNNLKFIVVGSLILAISTFFPWYADLDSYKIGDQFLGITGPASFVGFAILLMAGLSLWIFSYHLFERKMPRLPVREAIIHLAVAIESLFLLVLVNSIYFHPKFGVNITLKESQFGMLMAFAGAIILLIGGYIKNREETHGGNDVGHLEPLIKYEREHAQTSGQPVQSSEEPRKSFMFGEKSTAEKYAQESFKIRMDL